MRRPLEDGLSLMLGAGLGLGLMYLLDPERGPQRRGRLSKATNQTLGRTGALVGSAWHTVSDTARAASNTVSEHARDWSNQITPEEARAAGKRLHRRGQRVVDSATSQFTDTRDRLMDRVRGARESVRSVADRAASQMGYEREHSHIVGQTTCAIGSLALGAGLWYLFDPRLGYARRSKLLGMGARCLRETGSFLRSTGSYVSGKMQGVVAEGRTHLMNPPVTDEKLHEHIRAKLGHWVDHASAVDVCVVNGHVTLRGTLPSTEIPKVYSGVMGLRGVTGVDNQLVGGDPSRATSNGPSTSTTSASSTR